MTQKFYRLDLGRADYASLLNAVKSTGKENILKIILDARLIERAEAKVKAIAEARQARTRQTDEKIENALRLLVMEGREITTYSVAKMAKVSYNTVKRRQELLSKYRKGVNNAEHRQD